MIQRGVTVSHSPRHRGLRVACRVVRACRRLGRSARRGSRRARRSSVRAPARSSRSPRARRSSRGRRFPRCRGPRRDVAVPPRHAGAVDRRTLDMAVLVILSVGTATCRAAARRSSTAARSSTRRWRLEHLASLGGRVTPRGRGPGSRHERVRSRSRGLRCRTARLVRSACRSASGSTTGSRAAARGVSRSTATRGRR